MSTIQEAISNFKPVFEASLDAVCVLDSDCRIQYANGAMASLLELRKRELDQHPVLCDVLKMHGCEPSCRIQALMKSGEVLRLDELPATRKSGKLRLTLKVVALKSGDKIIGALASLRDTSGEVILQAKYHKLLQTDSEKDEMIADLREQLTQLQETMRRSRSS